MWRKSSHSAGGNCAEVAAWRKSSASYSEGNYAEVGQDGTVVAVRDSRLAVSPVLAFTPVAWRAFTDRVKRDEGAA